MRPLKHESLKRLPAGDAGDGEHAVAVPEEGHGRAAGAGHRPRAAVPVLRAVHLRRHALRRLQGGILLRPGLPGVAIIIQFLAGATRAYIFSRIYIYIYIYTILG